YTLVVNDTKQSITVTTGQTTTVPLGRIEVKDVSGTYTVKAAAGDFSNGTQVLDATLPTGTGFFVLPGSYTIDVAYQSHTKTFSIAVSGNTIVNPDDLRGWVVVKAPHGATLPDWAPATPPSYGPSSSLRYDNGVYHVYSGTTYLATAKLG